MVVVLLLLECDEETLELGTRSEEFRCQQVNNGADHFGFISQVETLHDVIGGSLRPAIVSLNSSIKTEASAWLHTCLIMENEGGGPVVQRRSFGRSEVITALSG